MKERSHSGVAAMPLDEEMERPAEMVMLQIPAGEVTLAGNLEIPKKARGLVLFAHGSGSSRRSPRNQAVAEVLRDAGLATLLFDLLTAEEEVEDAYTGHLRFDIGLLSRRLALVTKEIADDPYSRNLGIRLLRREHRWRSVPDGR
jgi:putative phosphoribosyl transferase